MRLTVRNGTSGDLTTPLIALLRFAVSGRIAAGVRWLRRSARGASSYGGR